MMVGRGLGECDARCGDSKHDTDSDELTDGKHEKPHRFCRYATKGHRLCGGSGEAEVKAAAHPPVGLSW